MMKVSKIIMFIIICILLVSIVFAKWDFTPYLVKQYKDRVEVTNIYHPFITIRPVKNIVTFCYT